LKKAIKELIFAYEDLPDSSKHRKMVPFMMIGTKNDIPSRKVNPEEVKSLMEVLRKHVKCDVQYASSTNVDETLHVLKTMFSLASDLFFY
jgi:hypothetical protein